MKIVRFGTGTLGISNEFRDSRYDESLNERLEGKVESSKRYERNRHGIRFMSRLEALWQLRRRILDVVPSEQDEETYFDNASDSTLKSVISKLGNGLPSIILNCATPAFWWGFSENGATLLGVWLHGWPSLRTSKASCQTPDFLSKTP